MLNVQISASASLMRILPPANKSRRIVELAVKVGVLSGRVTNQWPQGGSQAGHGGDNHSLVNPQHLVVTVFGPCKQRILFCLRLICQKQAYPPDFHPSVC